MADAAAFFANKKKKKKTFKFNANKIDASTIENKVHVDAPALSTDNDAAVAVSGNMNGADPAAADSNDATEQWDDEALAATLVQKKAVSSNNAAELLDMKALDLKRSEQGDIQEKLRLEENKAKLAAAKAGMEKEAQRLKEEKEKKEQGSSSAAAPTGSRFGAAAAGMTSSGGKWLPPHMRAGGAPLSSRFGMGPASQKLDTEDENLFPDLAAADAILEKQKSQGPAYKVPKKTPVGGGATWGSKLKKANTEAEEASEPEQATQEEEPKEAESESTSAVAPAQATEEGAPAEAAPEAAQATAAKAPIKPKKKKKKDLSTFKSAS